MKLLLDKMSSVSKDEGMEIKVGFKNVYASPRVFDQPPNGLRPIAIDGCNVAWGHGKDQECSYKGLVLCAHFFRDRGHQVKAFLPRHHQETMPNDIMDELIKAEILVFTPSRTLGKEGMRITACDDSFIVQYAVMTGGVVISNDNFTDLFDEQPTWRDTITSRVLQYTWISRDILMFRCKDTLDEFLRFPIAPTEPSPSPSGMIANSASKQTSPSLKSHPATNSSSDSPKPSAAGDASLKLPLNPERKGKRSNRFFEAEILIADLPI